MNSTVFLIHHGIKGQKWGVRRFQNPDGSLTPEGRKRYENYAQEALEKAHDAYAERDERMALKYADKGWEGYDKDPEHYSQRMKQKKYKDLADFVDNEAKPYRDKVMSLQEQLKNTRKGRDRERIQQEIKEANSEYWDTFFATGEQYITEFFGKTEKERNKGRDFIYDHSGMWW